MAHWLDKYLRFKPEVHKLYDDLDGYREFCVRQGYVFDEAHLYNNRTPWGDYQRSLNGKWPRDNWNKVIAIGRRG